MEINWHLRVQPGGTRVDDPRHEPERPVLQQEENIEEAEAPGGGGAGESALLLEPGLADLDGAPGHVAGRPEHGLMSRRQIGATTPAHDSVKVGVVDTLVATVVMEIAGDPDVNVGSLRRDDALFQEREVALEYGVLDVAVEPVRLGARENHPIPKLDVFLADLREVLELAEVDIRLELDVHRPQPPAVRQLDGEVAPLLFRLPAADLPVGPEQ